jgi:BMFP domain-containing protein YqiC
MIYTATEEQNERVTSFCRTMVESAATVNRPLSEKDCATLMLASAFDGITELQAKVAALEARLDQLESQN